MIFISSLIKIFPVVTRIFGGDRQRPTRQLHKLPLLRKVELEQIDISKGATNTLFTEMT
jgi:hypothetical protein